MHVECTEAGLDAILLPSPSPMIGIMIVSLQERHAVYRRAGHETNVTRSSCVRRAVGMRPPQSVTSGWRSTGRWYHQGTRACAHASRYPQGMLKHAGQQMPDKVARVAAAAAAAVERGTDRMAASVPERWPNRQHELQLSV